MSKKKGNLVEQHIDKIVLAAVGVLCVWLLISRVVTSSCYVEYQGRSFGPGALDREVSEDARRLNLAMQKPPTPIADYEPRTERFQRLIGSPIEIAQDTGGYPRPNPGVIIAGSQEFAIPEIPPLSEVKAGVVSGVGYVPSAEATARRMYSPSGTQLEDVDLVTVQAGFDPAELRARFNRCFSGEIAEEKGYSTPVFAAVQLQRQRQSETGAWPQQWQEVSRLRNNPHIEMLNISDKTSDLPEDKSVSVLMVQFNQPDVRLHLLQPEAYEFARQEASWLPPVLYAARQERLEEEARQEERRRREEAREERQRGRTGRRAGERTRPGGGLPFLRGAPEGPGATERELPGFPFGPGGGPERYGPPVRRNTDDDRQETAEYEKIKIGPETDILSLEELVVWAHDDSAEPGGTYRYRMRIGVFNPVAGTDQIHADYSEYKDDVILWSDFTRPTEPVDVPARLYFFPQIAIEQPDDSMMVTVEVAKKHLGKWYTEKFDVRVGEVIGKPIEIEPEQAGERRTFIRRNIRGSQEPEVVDYSTGAVLVDVVEVRDWAGSAALRARNYWDMLYAQAGGEIERLPIRRGYWPQWLREKYREIEDLLEEQKDMQPFREGGRTRPGTDMGELPPWMMFGPGGPPAR